MRPIAPRMKGLQTSPASILAKRARELRAQGREVILLSSGELEFATPPHVIEAAHRAASAGPITYTNVDGTSELKEAVREKLRRENAVSYAQHEVIVSNGSKQVMFNALMATLAPGDEVIVPAPYWASYLDLVTIAEGVPVIAETSEQSGWKLAPDVLERAITPRTRWLIINNPVNPTGGVYSQSELSGLADVLRRHPEIWVMSDDLYEHIVFDGASFATMAGVAPDLAERTLTVNGVSKAYAMMGWRIGYGGGPAELIADMVKVQSQSTSSASTIGQAAAVAALTGPQDQVRQNLRVLAARRQVTADAVNAMPGLSVRPSPGTFYAYVSCSGLLGIPARNGRQLCNDRDVAEFLLEKAGVVVLSGADCGLSPFFRINFAGQADALGTSFDRIAAALGEFSAL